MASPIIFYTFRKIKARLPLQELLARSEEISFHLFSIKKMTSPPSYSIISNNKFWQFLPMETLVRVHTMISSRMPWLLCSRTERHFLGHPGTFKTVGVKELLKDLLITEYLDFKSFKKK